MAGRDGRRQARGRAARRSIKIWAGRVDGAALDFTGRRIITSDTAPLTFDIDQVVLGLVRDRSGAGQGPQASVANIVVIEPEQADRPVSTTRPTSRSGVTRKVAWALEPADRLGAANHRGRGLLVAPDGAQQTLTIAKDGSVAANGSPNEAPLPRGSRVVLSIGTESQTLNLTYVSQRPETTLALVAQRLASALHVIEMIAREWTAPPGHLWVDVISSHREAWVAAQEQPEARARKARAAGDFNRHPVDASAWSLAQAISDADKRLDELLPPAEPVSNATLSAKFFEAVKIDPDDRIGILREHGWSHQTLREHDHRGPQWAYLTLAGHELRLKNASGHGDTIAFANALAGAAAALAASKQLWYFPSISRTITMVHHWLGLRPDGHAIGIPQQGPKREALRDLLAAAPWLALLLKDHNDSDLVVRCSLKQALECALLAPAGATFTRNRQIVRFTRRAKILQRIEVIDPPMTTVVSEPGEQTRDDSMGTKSVVADKSVLEALIFAAGTASGRHADFTAIRETLDEGHQALLDQTVSEWAPIGRGDPDDLRVLVDHRAQRLLLLNRSEDNLLAVQFEGGEIVDLDPFDVTPNGRVMGAATTALVQKAEKLSLTINQAPVVLPLPERALVDLDHSTTGYKVVSWMFQGRDDQLAAIDRVIAASPRSRKPIVIYGSRRSGKTTLGYHALEMGVEEKKLAGFITLDLSGGVAYRGGDESAYLERFTKDLRKRLMRELSRINEVVEVDPDITDPVDFLEELDFEWGGTRPPLGVLFDEFDSIFYRKPGSALYALVERFSNLHLDNLVLIATVQRHGAAVRGLKEWLAVQIEANLGPTEAFQYFSTEIDTGEQVEAIQRPLADPIALTHEVVARLGYRPYFWGALYNALERRAGSSDDEPLLVDRETIRREIDGVVRDDLFFSALLLDIGDDDLVEMFRKDTFSAPERRLLAEFSTLSDGVDYLTEGHLRKVFAGDLTPVAHMREREMLKQQSDRYFLDPPCLLEWARRMRLELDVYRQVRNESDQGGENRPALD